jgi:hypothetical protein
LIAIVEGERAFHRLAERTKIGVGILGGVAHDSGKFRAIAFKCS